jgi:hypothetical protein
MLMIPRRDDHEATDARAPHNPTHGVSVEAWLALEHVGVVLSDRHITAKVSAKGSMKAEAIAGVVADEGGDIFGLVKALWCVDSHGISCLFELCWWWWIKGL